MTDHWIVLLEAVGKGDLTIGHRLVDRLLQQVADCSPRALHAAGRCALQVVVVAASALDAHAVAVERWRQALRAIGAPAWPVVRVEVMTLGEFESDFRTAGGEDTPSRTTWQPIPIRGTTGDQLLRSVFEDPLTELPTAELFRAHVQDVLAPAQRPGTRHALLMLRVSPAAPSSMHPWEGLHDFVVVELVERLIGAVRDCDIVARLASDTFAVLVRDVSPSDVAELAQRVLATATDGRRELPDRLRLAGSVGVALSQTGWDADRLFAAAAAALGSAAAGGGGMWELFRTDEQGPGDGTADDSEAESWADDC